MLRDFRPSFFHDSNPSRLLINRLMYVGIRFRFRGDILSQSCLCGVQHTTETRNEKNLHFLLQNLFSFMIDEFTSERIAPDFPLKVTTEKLTFRFLLRGVQFVFAVWCTPRGDCLRGRVPAYTHTIIQYSTYTPPVRDRGPSAKLGKHPQHI